MPNTPGSASSQRVHLLTLLIVLAAAAVLSQAGKTRETVPLHPTVLTAEEARLDQWEKTIEKALREHAAVDDAGVSLKRDPKSRALSASVMVRPVSNHD